MNLIIYLVAIGIGGVAAGFLVRQLFIKKTEKDLQAKQKELLLEAKDEALKIKASARAEIAEKELDLKQLEKNLRKKEESLDRRVEALESEKTSIAEQKKEIDKLREELKNSQKTQEEALEKITKMKKEEAKEILLRMAEKEYKEDIISKIKEMREEVREQAQIEARKILASAIERLASEHTAETTTISINLPSEEMKGRIIGKEGRNIQAFEKITGVDLLIDETPDTVTISSFDPIRRQTAKMALERLITDGRIHPARIEEVVGRAKEELGKEMQEAGESACFELGITGFPPPLVKILGRLKFRTSYGQNILRHSIETAHLAAILSSELKANVEIVKKAALLHDIGKAVSEEVPGSHLQISCDIARKYGLSQDIIDAIAYHHEEGEPKSVEAIIVKAADAISGARPGARRESLESYIKRLTELENIANSFPGVEKSYAIQAGREVRIIVKPGEIDDLTALKLAKDIAQKIERDLQYPGQIKVNVIRETRAIEYAK